MTLQDAIARIFPVGVVRAGNPDSGSSFEVHGLPRNAVPQNCEVLASGQFQFSPGQALRESFLVKAEGLVVYFRICSAAPEGGYAEIAPSRGTAPSQDDLAF